jgi:prevent-host-death family protein
MSRKMTATEARTNLLTLLDEVHGGEEIEITRHGRSIARLVPATSNPKALKGRMAGTAVQMVEDELLFSTGEKWEVS